MISVNFAKSLKFRDCRSITSLASGLSRSRITVAHWYASRISRTSPKVRLCGVTLVCCLGGRVRRSRRAFAGCLGVFRWLVAPSRMARPFPRSVIPWTFLSRARPSPHNVPRLPLLLSLLQRRFRSTAGAAILYLSSSPDVVGLPSICLVRLSSI